MEGGCETKAPGGAEEWRWTEETVRAEVEPGGSLDGMRRSEKAEVPDRVACGRQKSHGGHLPKRVTSIREVRTSRPG